MLRYRIYTNFQEKEKKALVYFRMLPITQDDQVNDIEANFRDFDEGEEIALINYTSDDIFIEIERGKYDPDIKIDPKLPDHIKTILNSLVEDLKVKAPESSIRRVSDISGVFKTETSGTEVRIAIAKQLKEDKWPTYIDPCYEEDIIGDDYYEYKYFGDEESAILYLRSNFPSLKKQGHELLISAGINSPDSLVEKITRLIKEIRHKTTQETKVPSHAKLPKPGFLRSIIESEES